MFKLKEMLLNVQEETIKLIITKRIAEGSKDPRIHKDPKRI